MAGEGLECGGPKIKIQTSGYKIILNVGDQNLGSQQWIQPEV